jgi:hypothetical protein
MFYSLCNDKSLSVGFFLHRVAIVAAGRYLSIYIWKERACFNRHRKRERELASIQHTYIVCALSISHLSV